ncbi:MAG: flagellar motor protein MotB [Congregibacter sp.]
MSEADDDAPPGSPAWMATFADLMSLLMCFFVLLLSFSEMDVNKFKQIAGSMSEAFGVQNQMEFDNIPKGTSIIAQEFSPGETTPTPVETVQQVSEDTLDQSLRVGQGEGEASEAALANELARRIKVLLSETEDDAAKIKEKLADELATGKVDVETEGRTIIIRIREQGSFPSGSATLAEEFLPVMQRIRDVLTEVPGTISIEGHTDNIPLRLGAIYESNWGLSSSRALSVTHELLRREQIDDERVMVVGYSDTRPFTVNDTSEGRAANRRVEIVIRQELDESMRLDLEALRASNPDALRMLGVE